MKLLELDILIDLKTLYKKKISIVLIFYICTMFIACDSDVDVIYEITAEAGMPTFAIKDLETFYSDSGIVKVKIMADEMVRYDNPGKRYDEYQSGINVIFFDGFQNKSATLNCQYAIYYIDDELWEVKSNVEIINIEENESLNTEQLFWDLQNEFIYSKKFVRIKTQSEILFGQGFESNQSFSQWRILRPTGTITIEDEE